MLRVNVEMQTAVRSLAGHDESADISVHAFGFVIDMPLDIERSGRSAPNEAGVDGAFRGVVECEVGDVGPGVNYGAVHEPREYSLAAGIASEEHGVELDEIHDVAYIDIAERSAQRVGRIFGNTSVHREMTIVL